MAVWVGLLLQRLSITLPYPRCEKFMHLPSKELEWLNIQIPILKMEAEVVPQCVCV